MGLIDVEKLGYDAKKSGAKANRSGSSRPQVGAKSPPGRGMEKGDNPCADSDLEENGNESEQNGYIKPKNKTQSYRSHISAMSAKGR
jgi:hypothetical protein